MKKSTVFGVLVTILGIPAIQLAAEPAASAGTAASPQIRMRWQDFSAGAAGAQRVASLEAAIAKMKSLNSAPPTSVDYRRSWNYWANIHGYYGSVSPDGTVQQQIDYLNQNGLGQYTPYYKGITDQTPPDSIATTTWATCEHGGPPGSFFGWHRMYLYYFEQVLRWAAGDPNLRLPYWDYTNPSYLSLPQPYQNTTSVFYDWRRDPNINNGSATLSSTRTNVDRALGESNFFRYEQVIEGGVHGYVHCTVGPTCPVADMGDVPVAGNDPVFYSHHDNIDRLWACWQYLYPNPSGSWQNQQFSFPDAAGNLQTRPISDFLDSAPLGYVYDNVSNCKRSTPTALAAAGERGSQGEDEKEPAILARMSKMAVDEPLEQFDLGVPAAMINDAMARTAGEDKVRLVLRDVTADSPPGVLFDVFLSKKDGDETSRQHVGMINWFGAFHKRHDAEGHGDQGTGARPRTFEFDVTDALRALGEVDLMVEVEATHGRTMIDPEEAKAQRDSARSAFRAAAGLTIGAIELKMSGDGG